MKPFLIHLLIYLCVNAGLALVNYFAPLEEGQVRNLWFIWPLLGWGIGILAHGLAVQLGGRSKEGGLFSDKDVQGVSIHFVVYIAVNLLLIAINMKSSSQSLWFIWPLLGWGAGLALHAFLAYRAVMHRTVEQYSAEQRVLAEIENERLAAEMVAAVSAKEAAAAKPKPARKRAAKKPMKKPMKKPAAPRNTAKKRTAKKKTAGGKD